VVIRSERKKVLLAGCQWLVRSEKKKFWWLISQMNRAQISTSKLPLSLTVGSQSKNLKKNHE
jgi:hypothetical protein